MAATTVHAFCDYSGDFVDEGQTDTWSHYRCDCGAYVPTTSMGDDPARAGWRYLDLHQTPAQAAATGGDA